MTRQEKICKAIKERIILNFHYDGSRRVLEPYVLGFSNPREKLVVVGYQIGGYSESSKLPPWRSFEVGKIRNLEFDQECGVRNLASLTIRVVNPICKRE